MDCSPPGSSVHGIFQARVLEWGAIAFSTSSSGNPIIRMLVCLIWSQRFLRLSSGPFILFTVFCSSEVISIILSSSSLIRSSASDILLLIPSRVFLISAIVLFVSVCVFFNYSRFLWIDSCIFSILFSGFLIIFTIIFMNSFSGNFPISSSFAWTSSLFLAYSFICVLFLCLFFLFKLLCLRSPFPRLQEKLNSFLEEGWILSSFWFLLS